MSRQRRAAKPSPPSSFAASGPATLQDVALRAGVSRTTASYVLSRRGDTAISEATRERVFEAARALRYAKSAFVTGFQQGRAHTLGVLACVPGEPYPSDPVMNRALAGISSAAQAHGYHTLLYTGLPPHDGAEPPVEGFLDRRVDGLILIAPRVDSVLAGEIAQTHLPCVALCSRHVPNSLGFVDADNVGGARLAVDHLAALGHRRIAHVARAPLASSNFADRREGWAAALAARGLPFGDDLIVLAEERGDEAGRAALRALRALPDPPTAVFCDNDYAALNILRAAAALGLSVPRDLSVVGFDDSLQAPLASPPLTTIRQPLHEMGRRAARALRDLIEGEAGSEARREIVSVELIVRGSTAAVPQKF